MADPSYCIIMEAADVTAESLLLDTRRSGRAFSKEDLQGIAMSLLHIHEHGLIHGDFGSHNVGKFGNRWKTLSIRGSKAFGEKTDPKRGFFQPPEAVNLETCNLSLGDKNVGASLVPIAADPTFDIWAYGVVFYEAVAGLPLSPYRSLHKAKRALTTAELFKVGQWDERSLRKALRHIDGDKDSSSKELAKFLLHPNPNARAQSMREVLEHPYFGLGKLAGEAPVFDRPNLNETTNTVEINQYTEEHLATGTVVTPIAEVEESATECAVVSPQLQESLVDSARKEELAKKQIEEEERLAREIEEKRIAAQKAAEKERVAQEQRLAEEKRRQEEQRRLDEAERAAADLRRMVDREPPKS